jgi:hypothetical protein
MKLPRVRLSTLMLLIVIIALCIALVVQQKRFAHRWAQIQAEADGQRYLAIAEAALNAMIKQQPK